MSLDQVRAFRLSRQRLDRRAPAGSLLEVVRALCGVHAQLASSAELALWARIEGLERDEVRQALEERHSLIKTWAMRGTLHFVTPEDLERGRAELDLFTRISKAARKAIDQEAERLRAFVS